MKPDPQVKSGVGVIVCHKQRVLVGERIGSHGEGVYAFPGGHLEYTDVLKHHPIGGLGFCAEREVLEETGMIVRAYSPDNFRSDLFTTFEILSDNSQQIYVTPYIIAEYLHGGTVGDDGMIKPLEPKKCKGWRWITLDEIAAMETSDSQKTWIPVHQVLYYLKQLWRI
jgi:8-oxo-dGTP diphosphatase